MVYTKRREIRYRMVRKTAIINQIKDVVASAKECASEILCAVGISFGIFIVLPIVLSVIASTVK